MQLIYFLTDFQRKNVLFPGFCKTVFYFCFRQMISFYLDLGKLSNCFFCGNETPEKCVRLLRSLVKHSGVNLKKIVKHFFVLI
jgi:hypothetical protein